MSYQRLTFVLYICHFAALFCVSAQFHGSNESSNTGIHLLPAYAIAMRAHLLNSTTCGMELRDFQDAVDRRILWALKTLDSSGSPNPGFLYGNNFWLGSRSQCLDTMNRTPFEIAKWRILNNTQYRNPQNEFPPFEVNYFVAHVRHNSTLQYHIYIGNENLITLGLCLPASCSTNNVSFILEEIFRDRDILTNNLYSVDLSLIQVKDLKDDYQWLLSGAIPLICVGLVLTFSMMISGTIYDIFIHQKCLKTNNKIRNIYGTYVCYLRKFQNAKRYFFTRIPYYLSLWCNILPIVFLSNFLVNIFVGIYRNFYINTNSVLITAMWNFVKNTDSELRFRYGQTTEMEVTDSSSPREKNRIGNVLMCFSVYTTTKMIFKMELDAASIPVIHGIRFLSMLWVIIIHSCLYTLEYFDNKIWALRLTEGILGQVISNGSLAVDTFFFLSGLLLTYTHLKRKTHEERNKPINCGEKLKEFFVRILRRFIRLTPPYIMMIGIMQLNSAWYDKTSQFYVEERLHKTCAKYWWRNLLYINNLFGHNTMCMDWSWYLSNNMQLFIIGLALLILSTVYFYMAVAILGTLLISSIILSGYISYIYEYVPTLDEWYRLIDALIFPPWVRIGPYIIGMITGYIVIRLNKKIVLKKNIVILCWSLAAACNILVLFGLYNRQISVMSSAIYVAFSRTVWAIGIAWVVIVCCTKHGGIVKELLTFKMWIPLSRLTYCAYLLNPFIIHSIRLHETSTHLEIMSMSVIVIGYCGISYFCAYVLYLMAESPYISLMQMFIQSRSRKKSKEA